MKIIQAFVVFFAVIGCLALALGGYYLYSSSQGGGENFLTKLRQSRAAETTATAAQPAGPAAKSEYASVISDYQPTPTPAPPAAAAPAGVAAAAPGAVAPGVAPVAAAQATPSPIKTPKPDEGKIRSWPSGKKWVALTYDDGPHPEWTPKMIELLKSKNVKATFFLLGSMIERHPEVGKSLVDNGFEIGNHTYSHTDLNSSKMTPEKIRDDELGRTNKLIAENIIQQPITIFRPPFGNTPKKLETICQEMGIHIVCWNIDTDDWRKETTADKMAENVMKNLSDGAIILMHDKHEKTYDCTAKIIDQIRAKGYEFVTVSELLGLKPLGPGPASSAPQPAGVTIAPAAAAPVAAQPVAAAPAAPAQPVAQQGALPTPAPAAPATAGQAALPAPAAAGTPIPVAPVDSSKLTQPPPQR